MAESLYRKATGEGPQSVTAAIFWLKRLRAYRKEWDEQRGVWKDRPQHDDASHGADAFLTFACSGVAELEELVARGRSVPAPFHVPGGALSWMG